MASPQPVVIPGNYSVATILTTLPPSAYPHNLAWCSDRTPSAGYMISDGTAWGSNVGPSGTVAVGTTSTLAAGASATVTNSGTASAGVFNFGIPQGAGGSAGLAATIAIGMVTALAAGVTPTVANVGTANAAVLNWGIPAGATGAAGLGTVSPAVSTRALGTVFQPSTTKSTYCSYSCLLSVTNPLLVGTSSAQVQILSDASNPPTTVRSTAGISSGVGLTVTVALTTGNTIPVDYIVPPSHFVKLVSTTAGTATASIASQYEETLG